MIDISKITRLELVGPALPDRRTLYPDKLYVDVQDDGRTLKVVWSGFNRENFCAHHEAPLFPDNGAD